MKSQILKLLCVILFLEVLAVSGVGSDIQAQESTLCDDISIETTLPWPTQLYEAVSEALCRRPSNILPGSDQRLILTSLDTFEEDTWAIATTVMRPEKMPSEYSSILIFDNLLILAHKEGDIWQVALRGTEEFIQLIQKAPSTVLDDNSRAYFLVQDRDSLISPLGLPSWLNLKWPWGNGQSWSYNQGPHDISSSSLDFGPPSPGSWEVVAAATGVFTSKCEDPAKQDVGITLEHAGNYATQYLHLDKYSISVSPLTTVYQGHRIGLVYNGYNFSSICGSGTGPHLHFMVGTIVGGGFQPQSVVGTILSGWELGSNGCFKKSGEADKCPSYFTWIPSDNFPITPPLTTPDYNGDGKPDLYGINKVGTGAGHKTEVHIMDGANGYKSYLLNAETILGDSGTDCRWDFATGAAICPGKLNKRVYLPLVIH